FPEGRGRARLASGTAQPRRRILHGAGGRRASSELEKRGPIARLAWVASSTVPGCPHNASMQLSGLGGPSASHDDQIVRDGGPPLPGCFSGARGGASSGVATPRGRRGGRLSAAGGAPTAPEGNSAGRRRAPQRSRRFALTVWIVARNWRNSDFRMSSGKVRLSGRFVARSTPPLTKHLETY